MQDEASAYFLLFGFAYNIATRFASQHAIVQYQLGFSRHNSLLRRSLHRALASCVCGGICHVGEHRFADRRRDHRWYLVQTLTYRYTGTADPGYWIESLNTLAGSYIRL